MTPEPMEDEVKRLKAKYQTDSVRKVARLLGIPLSKLQRAMEFGPGYQSILEVLGRMRRAEGSSVEEFYGPIEEKVIGEWQPKKKDIEAIGIDRRRKPTKKKGEE